MTLTYPYRYLFDFDATSWSTPGPTAYDHLPADGGLVVLTRPTATKPFFAVPRSDVDVHRIGTRWLLYCDSASAADIDVIQYTPAGGGSYSVRWTETLSPGDAAEVIYLGAGNYAHRTIAAPAVAGYSPPASAQHYWNAHGLAGAVGSSPSSVTASVGATAMTVTNGTATIVDIAGDKWLGRDSDATDLLAAIASIPQPYTVLMTHAWTPSPPISARLFEGNGAALVPRIIASLGGYRFNSGADIIATVGSFNTTPLALVFIANGASSVAWLRGGHTAKITGNAGSAGTGTNIYWGSSSSTTTRSAVGELMICNTALSLAEINAWGAQAKVSWSAVT